MFELHSFPVLSGDSKEYHQLVSHLITTLYVEQPHVLFLFSIPWHPLLGEESTGEEEPEVYFGGVQETFT